MFSTGRGGAGNMRDQHVPGDEPHLQSVKSDQSVTSDGTDKKVYYLTGRGGAGNIKSSSELPSPRLVPQGSNTPQIQSDKFTTGRGGFGNIIKNDNAELTRKLQDVDSPKDRDRDAELYAVTSNKSFSVGRGGFGNVMSQTKSRTSQTSSDHGPVNLMAILSHGPSIAEEGGEIHQDSHKKKRGLMGKLKGIFQN